MTKAQWVRQWREIRIQKRLSANKSLTSTTFVAALREVYDYIYLPKQTVFIDLVERYQTKLSPEFIIKSQELIKKWKPEAKVRASDIMKNLIYNSNSFLKMIPKDEFKGAYIPIPIIYD